MRGIQGRRETGDGQLIRCSVFDVNSAPPMLGTCLVSIRGPMKYEKCGLP